MSDWPAVKAKRVLAALLRIGFTEFLNATGGQIMYSHFMTATKSDPECFIGSPKEPA